MNLINQARFGMKYLKQLVAFVRYGTKEVVALLFAMGFGTAGYWLFVSDNKFLADHLQSIRTLIAIILFVIAALLFSYVLYRLIFRLAIPKSFSNDQPLPSAIKGLMAFAAEDGELFRRLERESELAKLKDYLDNPQIGLVVMMGESGAGKTSLLRAGLSHLLQGKGCRYVYWEARPTEAVAGLLKSIKQGLGVEVADLNSVLALTIPAVIVLDQFEQLLPDKIEFTAIFNLLKAVVNAAPPHNLTWIVAFRREYLPYWRDFELDNQLKQCETLSLKLFSVAQAQNVMAALAESAGLSLEQPLLAGFIDTVKRDEHLSPVDIGIGLLMLQELAVERQKQELSLTDYQFAGGSQGLFVQFLKSKIEQRFDDKREQEALFKALLALVDLNRNQRVAEGKLLAELAEQAQGLEGRLLEYALDHLASEQVRLLEKIVRADGCVVYRLPHDSMIPALRQLGNSVLDAVTQANLTLQTAFAAWQNSAQKNSRYLLSGKELKQVLRFQQQLNMEGKEEFLRKSVKRKEGTIAGIVLSIIVYSIVFLAVWWHESDFIRIWRLSDGLHKYSPQLKTLVVRFPYEQHLELLGRYNQLTSLEVEGYLANKNTDLNGLKELRGLTSLKLDLSHSGVINDLNVLKELKNLSSLNLIINSEIDDLSVLKDLKKLKSLSLDLEESKISDLDVLKELKGLTSLTLKLNGPYNPPSQIININALKELKSLTFLKLDLSYSSISDLSSLQELKDLTTLNLGLNSEVEYLGILWPLKKLNSLTLNFNDSPSIDLTVLKNLEGLTSLSLDRLIFKDLIVLNELKNLTSLNLDISLSHSLSKNLSILQDLKGLTSLNLDLSHSPRNNLEVLQELKDLTSLSLDLSDSQISDLSILNELKKSYFA